jgi:hypothetical protein
MADLIEPSDIKYQDFLLETNCDVVQGGILDKFDLSKKFELDVYSENNKMGTVVMQGESIVKRPFKVCTSTRKINKEITYRPYGFTKLTLPTNSLDLEYSRPREIIPNGCWCKFCNIIGPEGHTNNCSRPVKQSLNLTLTGMITCLYSTDSKIQKKIKEMSNRQLAEAIQEYIDKIYEIEDTTESSHVYKRALDNITDENNDILMYNYSDEPEDISELLTNVSYETVHSISTTPYFFTGGIIVQYNFKDIEKRSSIRIYEDGKILIVKCPWNKQNLYKDVIDRINNTGQNIEYKNSFISAAVSSFRLLSVENESEFDIEQVSNYFKDETKTNFRVSKFTRENDIDIVRNYIGYEDKLYRYEIVEPGKGKMSIRFEPVSEKDGRIIVGEYKITTQLYNSGVAQSTFSYRKDNKKQTKEKMKKFTMDQQFDIIKKLFNEIRGLLIYHFKTMSERSNDLFKIRDKEKMSNNIYNTVPGDLPYVDIKHKAGYILEIFDEISNDWTEEYIYLVKKEKKKKEKGSKGKTEYKYYGTTKKPIQVNIDKEFEDLTTTTLTSVELSSGKIVYPLEKYDKTIRKYIAVEGPLVEFEDSNTRTYKKTYWDNNFTGKTKVAKKSADGNVILRPVPYSFYGKCQGGQTQYLDRIGNRARKDNKYYPFCQEIKDADKNKNKNSEKMVRIILDGLTDEELNDGNIIVDYHHGAVIEDKYAGTFKPGTTDIGNTITFWDENSENWEEGVIEMKQKTSGMGNDYNYTMIYVRTEADEEETDLEKLTITSGKQLHPKHRESRNFKGINNFKDKDGNLLGEEEKKNILIGCAKKLNLIKKEVDLEKADNALQSNVINKLYDLTGYKTFQEIAKKTNPFASKEVTNLEKVAYTVAVIPNTGVRCLLFVLEEVQYIIDSDSRIMKVYADIIDSEDNTSLDLTLLDGYIDNNVYYPIDIIYYRGDIVKKDYIKKGETDNGRLFMLQQIAENSLSTVSSKSIKIKNPLGTIFDKTRTFIGPSDPNVSIMEFIKLKRLSNSNLVFIPQTGIRGYMIWKNRVHNSPIVLKLIKEGNDKNTWALGLINNEGTPEKLLKTPIELLKIRNPDSDTLVSPNSDTFIKLTLNLMVDGKFNPKTPYLNIVKVSKYEAMSLEDTVNKLNLIAYPILDSVFEDTEDWIFQKLNIALEPGNSSQEPLVRINFNELS